MPTFAILPVKLNNSKTRLSTIFSAKERKKLTIAMLKDVLSTLEKLRVVIISNDDIPAALPGLEFDFVYESEKRGLKEAVKKAMGYAIENGASSTLFIPPDTPLIRSRHIDDILRLGKKTLDKYQRPGGRE